MGIIDYNDLIEDDGTFENLKDNIKDLKADLLDLVKVGKKVNAALNPKDTDGIEKANKELEQLEKTSKDILKVEKAMQKAKKKTIDLTNEELVQREALKIENRKRIQIAKQQAIILKEEKNSIASLRAQLSLVTLEWKKLSKEELDNTKEGKKLVATKLKLTNTLKKVEKATGDNRREVGNYGIALKRLNKVGKVVRGTFLRLFVGRTIIDGIARLGGAFVDLFNEAKAGNEDFQKFANVIAGVVERLKEIGVAILSAVLPFIQAVIRRFQFFSTVISDVAGEGTALGFVFDLITSAIKGIINVLLDLPFIFAGVSAAMGAIGDSVSAQFRIMALEVEKLGVSIKLAFSANIIDIANFNKRLEEINKEISASNKKIITNAGQIGDAYTTAADAARAEFAKFEAEQDILDAKTAESAKKREGEGTSQNSILKERNDLLREQETLLIAISITEGNRIKAIEALEKKITDAEIGSIEDRQARLQALEEQRFKAEQAQRKANFQILVSQIQQQDQEVLLLFGEGSEELEAFRAKTDAQIFQLTDLNNQVEIDQLKEHEENKLKIKKEFAEKAVTGEFAGPIEAEAIDTQDDLDAAASDKKIKAAVDANEKIKESNQQLIEDIADTAAKVGDIIVDLFEKQADLSEKRVDEQEDNLSRARERAAKGLSANLAFEEQELAKRQAEQQRANKDAEQAARLLTLFNLVAAYAGSGDTNALARGLVDFSLLTALTAGFEEGGFTGSDGSNSTVKGLVHANEYVVTAADTARFGLVGKTGGEFGSAMGDYFDPQSPVLTNPYQAQKEAFKQGVKQTSGGNSEMVNELKAIKTHLAKQPNIGIAIEEVYENVYRMIKKESKSNLTKISKKFLRG